MPGEACSVPHSARRIRRSLAGAAVALVAAGLADAQTPAHDQRPAGITGATWQFGPLNRWTYTHMSEVLPGKVIRRDPLRIEGLPGLETAASDLSFSLEGTVTTLADAMDTHFIDGVLALKAGRVVLERYAGTLTPEHTHLLWSVSKTITGLTAASVHAEGLIDLDARVADYVPDLADSGWGSDRLRDLLDMRDASAWTEDYAAPDSTVRRQDCADGLLTGPDCAGIPVVGNYVFLPTVPAAPERYGQFVYKSGTTDVIAWVLESATGQRFADLVSQRLWKPIGAELDAGITVDVGGFTLASGGIHASLRDVARVGLLMANYGRVGDTQVIPEAWLREIFEDNGARPWPGEAGATEKPYYRNFVWGIGDGRGSVQARGVHGQTIYVVPETGVVIAMLSSWPDATGGAPGVGEHEQLELLRAIETALIAPP
jgi:CubicO group peptidase (beta-lactamase class C family)